MRAFAAYLCSYDSESGQDREIRVAFIQVLEVGGVGLGEVATNCGGWGGGGGGRGGREGVGGVEKSRVIYFPTPHLGSWSQQTGALDLDLAYPEPQGNCVVLISAAPSFILPYLSLTSQGIKDGITCGVIESC